MPGEMPRGEDRVQVDLAGMWMLPCGVTMGWADISAAPLPSSAKGGTYVGTGTPTLRSFRLNDFLLAVPLGALLAALLPAAAVGGSPAPGCGLCEAVWNWRLGPG